MRRVFFAWGLVLALGCGNRQKAEAPAETQSSAPSAEQPAPPPLQRVPPSGSEAGHVRAEPAKPDAPAPVGLPKPAPGLQAMLVPPSTPGASRFGVEGCLAQTEQTEAAGSRFPAGPPTRGPARDSVQVSPLGTGSLVVHELEHGCCLKADVTSSLEGQTVTLTETLSGQSCRCRCRSTVRVAVGLRPGDYSLKIVTDESGRRRTSYEAPFSVR